MRKILHDLNNYIAVIIGHASVGETIANTPRCIECRTGYQATIAACHGMKNLVIEAYQLDQTGDIPVIDLNAHFSTMKEHLHELSKVYKVELTLTYDVGDKCFVNGDIEMCGHVTRKLVENSAKAGATNVHIHYQTINLSAVQMVLSDNGKGMDSATLDRIGFMGGCGVSGGQGIRLVREMINGVGGVVTWDSREGVGTWVTIRLRKVIPPL